MDSSRIQLYSEQIRSRCNGLNDALKNLAITLVSLAVCFILIQLGNHLALPFGFASLVWPMAGVMFGLYLLFGNGVLLATFIASLFSLRYSPNDIHLLPFAADGLLALGATIQMFLAKHAVMRFCQLPIRSHSPIEIIKFLAITGPLSCILLALLTAGILLKEVNYSAEIVAYISLAVWIGNLLSVVFITPVILFLWPNQFVRKAQKPFAAIFATALVMVTIFSVYLLSNYNHRQQQERAFINATNEFIEEKEVILTSIKHNLTALDGLFQASEYISKHEFEQFAKELFKLHDDNIVRAFAWLPKIEHQQRRAFELLMKQQGEPNQVIRQLTEQGIAIAQEQAFYLPIKYSSPYEKNKQAIGLDVLTHPIAGASVSASIEQKTFVLTPLLSLIQQQDKFTGFIVYYPSFGDINGRSELLGLTEAVLEIDKFLAELHNQPLGHYYTYKLTYDTDSVFTHKAFNDKAQFRHKVDMMLFDKPAQLEFVSTPSFEQGLIYWSGFIILLTGCILGVICVMFVFFVVTFNASLSRQVTESTQKLLDQNEKLAKANRAKNLFLANISHEYRTPLNAIIGFTEIAQNDICDPVALGYFKQINDSSNLLLGIVNDVLDYSKIQAGELRLERRAFHLERATQTVIDILHDKAQQKGIDIKFQCNQEFAAWVLGDEVRYKQILVNLLNNAIKFTQRGCIVIHCRGIKLQNVKSPKSTKAEANKRQFVISVEDSGIGISEQALSDLFKPFSQAESSTNRRFGGTGLGLSIVRQLSHLMNGEVTASSELGKGSKFIVHLPLELTQAPTQITEPSTFEFDYQDFTVLVAEDNKVNQMVISKHLEHLKINFSIAEDGEQALAALELTQFDLILMDLQMPVMDGFTACTEIKQDPRLKRIPIVILSASVGTEEKEKANALGIYDYIEKPFKQVELIKVFNKYLG